MCGTPASEARMLGLRLNRSQGSRPRDKRGMAVSVVRCNGCGLVYSDPQPTPVDIQDHYGVPPETYWTEEYLTVRPDYFAANIAIAKRLLNFKSGMTVLDVGAGVGKCMIALQNAEFDTYGLEPSIPFRDRAIGKMGMDPERLRLGMMEELDYPEGSFDFITFGAVLEHLYHPAECIERALGWLKPGGVIQIEVPSSDWLFPKFFNAYFRLIGTNYTTHLSPMHEPFHMYEFTKTSFEKLAERLPFDIVHCNVGTGEVFHFPKFMHGLMKSYMRRTGTGMQLHIWLRKK